MRVGVGFCVIKRTRRNFYSLIKYIFNLAARGDTANERPDRSWNDRAAATQNYDTQYSHVVTHHSTDCAIASLTSGIGRDPVLYGVYGRRQEQGLRQVLVLCSWVAWPLQVCLRAD